MDHFWKAKKAIQDGLLGEVVWASGGFGRNRNQRGEWNYAIDPEATDKTLDWKAFSARRRSAPSIPSAISAGGNTGTTPAASRPTLLSHGLAAAAVHRRRLPVRVTSSGGIYLQKDREVPDTFFMNVDYPAWTMQLACSVGSGVGAPLVIHGSQATLFVGQNSESLNNTQMEIVPDQEYREEFTKKTGAETMKIDVQPFPRGSHPHMDNFLESVRSRKEPNFPAKLGYQAMAAIAMGVLASSARSALLRSPPAEDQQQAGDDVTALRGQAQHARDHSEHEPVLDFVRRPRPMSMSWSTRATRTSWSPSK